VPVKGDDPRPPRKLGRGLSEVSHVFLSGAGSGPAPGPKADRPGGSEAGGSVASEGRRPGDAARPPAGGLRASDGGLPGEAGLPAGEPQARERAWLPRSVFVSITSGDGVRGKTLLAASVAYGLQARGRRVALVNADPRRPDLRDALRGGARQAGDLIEEASVVPMVDAPGGPESEAATVQALQAAARDAQTVVIDTSPRFEGGPAIWRAAALSIVVAEPGPEKMEASYVTVKRVHSAGGDARIGLVLNSVRSYAKGEECFRKLAEVARKFLKINLRNYGCVLRDGAVSEAYERAIPLVKAFPDSRAAKCIDAITGLIVMEQSAIARRRREVSYPECVLRRGRSPALRS